MAIKIGEDQRTFYIEGTHSAYAFRVDEKGFLEHLHYGPAIGHEDLTAFRQRGGISFPPHFPGRDESALYGSYQHIPSELLFFGTGNYREPTVVFSLPNGDRTAEFLFDSFERCAEKPQLQGMPSLRGGETLIVRMKDAPTGMICELYYTGYDNGSVARRIVYRNGGTETVTLTRAYSFQLPLPIGQYDAISLHGSWGSERQVERAPLRHGTFSVDSARGTSSAVLNPFLALCDRDATEEYGNVYGISLIYSSSYTLKAQMGEDGRVNLCGGVNDFDFSWELAPGEAFATPEVLLTYSCDGVGGMSRNFHDLFREYLLRPEHRNVPHPIIFNHWEATYFNSDEENLKALAESVKGTGIDTFVLDDGWFGVRKDETVSMGDWTVNPKRFPHGLDAFIRHLHSCGMKAGLWFEPEAVSEDSELFRVHPDYAIGSPGRGRCACRHEYLLDLTRKEVRDQIVDSVNSVLKAYEIDYVKWDFNRNLTEFFGQGLTPAGQKGFAHRYALGLYDLFDRIVLANPQIYFEGCSGGGGRFDAGILAYFSQIWTSDDSDAEERTRIQYGTSLVYPLSAMSCHVSAVPNHQTGRVTDMKTRADIARLGSFGYELDTADFSEAEKQQIAQQIKDYRTTEGLVCNGDLYRTEDPFRSNYFGFLLVSKDKKEAFLTAYRRMCGANDEIRYLRVRGLDADTIYRLEGAFTGEYSGKTLMTFGLPQVFCTGDYKTMQISFKAVD